MMTAALATLAQPAGAVARRLAPVVLGAALMLVAGCAAPPVRLGPTVATPPADLLFVIPAGTANADMRGEPSFKIPSELTVITGQSIAVQNDDQAMHYFAEAPIAPGQTYRKTFGRPGEFGYGSVLSCSVAERHTVTVTVVDRLPAGSPGGPAEPAAPARPR